MTVRNKVECPGSGVANRYTLNGPNTNIFLIQIEEEDSTGSGQRRDRNTAEPTGHPLAVGVDDAYARLADPKRIANLYSNINPIAICRTVDVSRGPCWTVDRLGGDGVQGNPAVVPKAINQHGRYHCRRGWVGQVTFLDRREVRVTGNRIWRLTPLKSLVYSLPQ